MCNQSNFNAYPLFWMTQDVCPLGTEHIKLLIISGDIASQAIFAPSNKSSLVLQFSRLILK